MPCVGLKEAFVFRRTTSTADCQQTHLDASGADFVQAYGQGDNRPDWVVTSPPYKNAFAILKQALHVAQGGVVFKLRLSFLEPTKTRGQWLKDNPPSLTIVLPCAVHRGRKCNVPEAWFMWYTGEKAHCPIAQHWLIHLLLGWSFPRSLRPQQQWSSPIRRSS
ncbi:unnamed protein product [Pylaiella littoralis]